MNCLVRTLAIGIAAVFAVTAVSSLLLGQLVVAGVNFVAALLMMYAVRNGK